jgi:hypothetical protein
MAPLHGVLLSSPCDGGSIVLKNIIGYMALNPRTQQAHSSYSPLCEPTLWMFPFSRKVPADEER